jgi:hypothetical protein
MTSTPSQREEPEPIEAEFEPAARSLRSPPRGALAASVTRLETLGWSLGAAVLGAITAVVALNAGLGGRAGDLLARTASLDTAQAGLTQRADASERAVASLKAEFDTQSQRLLAAETGAQSAGQQLAAINRQLAALAGASTDLAEAGGNPLGRLIDRVAELEGRLEEDAEAPRTTRQMQRALADLSDQVSALDEATAGFTSALNRRQTALAALEDSVGQIEADLRDLETRLADAEDVGDQLGDVRKSVIDLSVASESNRAPVLAAAEQARLVRALDDLTRAAEKGRPFVDQHQTLSKLLPDDAGLAALREAARRGAPSLTELRRDFPDARRAAERVTAAATDDGWNWLRGSLSGLVTVRRTNADDRTSVVLRQASDAIDAGDARSAVAAVDDLTGDALAAMTAWRDRAERRAALDEQVAALNARLLNPDDSSGEGG